MWIMIAGPYSTGNADEQTRAQRLRELNLVAHQVWQKGHVPIVGVNAALPVIEAAGPDHYDPIMMPMCLQMAERCDAVLRIGGDSEGADREVQVFEQAGKPIYRSIEDVPTSS